MMFKQSKVSSFTGRENLLTQFILSKRGNLKWLAQCSTMKIQG